MLHEMGHDTGVDLDALVACAAEAQQVLGRPLGSHVLTAGPVDWRGRTVIARLCAGTWRRWRGWSATRRARASGRRPSGARGGCASSAPMRCGWSRSATSTPSPSRRAPTSRSARWPALPRAAAARGRRAGVLRARLQRPLPVARGRCSRPVRAPTSSAAARRAGTHPHACARRPPRRRPHRPDVGPAAPRRGGRAAERSGRRASLALLPELAMIGAALGGRRVRLAAAAVLALAVHCSPTRRGAPPFRGPTTTRAAWRPCSPWRSASRATAPRASRWWCSSAAARSRAWAAWPHG